MSVITKREFFDFYGFTLIPVGLDDETDFLRTETVLTIQKNYLKYIERIVREEAALQSKRAGIEKSSLRQLAKYFFLPGMWDPYFGGEPWGKIATALCELKGADVQKAVMVIDHIHDLEHNTATVMDRCMSGGEFHSWLNYKLKATPEQIAKHCSPPVRQMIKLFGHAQAKKSGVIEEPEFDDLGVWYILYVIKETDHVQNSADKKILGRLRVWVEDNEPMKFKADELKRIKILTKTLFGAPLRPIDGTEDVDEIRETLMNYINSL